MQLLPSQAMQGMVLHFQVVYQISGNNLLSLPGRGTLRERKISEAASYEALGLSPVAGDYVAFLEMYLDESYGDSYPNIVVAGFVSHINHWAEFASIWKVEVLERFHIPFLHMKDLWNTKASKYRHLSQSDMDQMFEIAKSLIVQHVDMGIGCVIKRDDFIRASSHNQRSTSGTDYTVGVTYCLSAIRQYLGSVAHNTTLSVFLEDGHRNTRQAINLLKSERERQQSSFDSIIKTDDGAIIWRDPERDSLGINLGVIDAGNKATMLPLQAADLIAFNVLSARENKRFWDTLESFAAKFPLLVYEPSVKSLQDSMSRMEESRVAERRKKRRFENVLREIRRSGGQAENVDKTSYILNVSEVASAEEILLNRLGLSQPDGTFKMGVDLPADAVVTIQCVNCQKAFTLRGFSQQMELFVCPECGERHVEPKPMEHI